MEPLNSRAKETIKLDCFCHDLILKVGEEFAIPVLVINECSEKIDSDPPNGIFLSYCWLSFNGGIYPDAVYSTGLKPPIGPGDTRRVLLKVSTPKIEGEYILRIILSQIGCFEITGISLSGITVLSTQRRPEAILFNEALKSGNYRKALEYYLKDREYLGIDNKDENVVICKIKTVKKWCHSESLPYKVLKESSEWPLSPPYQPGRSSPIKYLENVTLPELYIAEVHDAIVTGGIIPILIGDEVALIDDEAPEIKYGDEIVSYEISPESILIRFRNHQGEGDIPDIEKGIFLCGPWGYNYFHWLIEIIPKFWVCNQCPEYNMMPLIISKEVPTKFLDIIQTFDTQKRDIIFVDYGVRYRVHKLVIPSQFFCSNVQKQIVSPLGVKYLKEKLRREETVGFRESGKRLYIQRRDPLYRKLLNEHEISALFERYDFKFIEPAQLSIPEQISLFSKAEILAGPHGAGWTNMIFTPPSAKGIMLLGDKKSQLYSNIAQIIGLDLVHIHGECVREQTIDSQFHCDFLVDVEEIEFSLNAVCGGSDDYNDKKIQTNRNNSTRLFTGNLPQLAGSTAFGVDLINNTRIWKNNVEIKISLEKKVVIQGWAVDSEVNAPAGAVFVTFDTGLEYRAYYSISRPDVAEHFGDSNLLHTGFVSIIPLECLAGCKAFGIKIVSNDREGYYYPAERFSFSFVQ